MGQSPSSMRNRSRQRSFRGFMRRNKLNKSSLSHTFSLPASEEYPELMNVNSATEEQLMTLPSVNRQLAREIVRHRQMIGRFKRVDDLALVSGIGAEKLELLRPEICTNSKKQISRASSCTQSLDSIRLSNDHKLCSVNSCSIFQLQCVPGLNQEIAANIIDYRDKKGPFKSLDDLIKVRGMDIIRLSTVKAHLSLEPRKCESVQHLTNGHVNGWADHVIKESIVSSTPKSPHRKSVSMPTTLQMVLPNGFATAPVNDILELLSAYSHRPVVDEVFMYERNGTKCRRIASWNLHQLSIDKITNPGVREVVCMTILENRLSIIAIQDVQDEAALKIICDELNSPILRRVREWRCNSHRWDYCISELFSSKPEAEEKQRTKLSQRLGFIFETANRGTSIEDIDLAQVCLLTECNEVRQLVDGLSNLASDTLLAAPQAFLISSRPYIIVNVYVPGELSDEDRRRIDDVCQLSEAAGLTLCFVGEWRTRDNLDKLLSCQPLLPAETASTLDEAFTGRSEIVLAGSPEGSHFTGHSGCVKSGLSHLAIPRGWSWGGHAAPTCPVWAELKVPD